MLLSQCPFFVIIVVISFSISRYWLWSFNLIQLSILNTSASYPMHITEQLLTDFIPVKHNPSLDYCFPYCILKVVFFSPSEVRFLAFISQDDISKSVLVIIRWKRHFLKYSLVPVCLIFAMVSVLLSDELMFAQSSHGQCFII